MVSVLRTRFAQDATTRRALFAGLASLAVHGLFLLMFGDVSQKGGAVAGVQPFIQATLSRPEQRKAVETPAIESLESLVVPSSVVESPAESVLQAETLEKAVAATTRAGKKQRTDTSPATPTHATISKGEPKVQSEQRESMEGGLFPGPLVPPSRVEIGFEFFSGKERQSVGKGVQLYQSDSAGKFVLTVRDKTEQADAGASLWSLAITGRVLKSGLLPISYQTQGVLAARLIALNNRTEKESSTSAGGRSGRMPDGIADRQSFLYQFMFQPPTLPVGRMMISSGESYSMYSYFLAGAETFSIPEFGDVRAIMLRFSSDERRDSIDLWLAPTLHYLPVKVRYTDEDGQVLEQQAVSLGFK